MKAVILAAGESTRFFKSGGMIYKQVYEHENEPIIKRIVRLVQETKLFNDICVVLGENKLCNDAIKQALKNYSVEFIVNDMSRMDNNFLSLMTAINLYQSKLDSGILIIESDCIFDKSDITSLVKAAKKDEVVWQTSEEKIINLEVFFMEKIMEVYIKLMK